METMPTTYASVLQHILQQEIGKAGDWQRSKKLQSSKVQYYLRKHNESTVPTPDQMHWRSLIMQAHYGSKKSYGRLLHEIDDWLEVYLLRIGFDGDYDMVIIDILLAVHDKIGTYDPKVSVVSWLMSIADFKLASARRNVPDAAEILGPFSLPKKRSPWVGKLS